MQSFSHASIGTQLTLLVRTEHNISRLFDEIISFLDQFETQFSRFIQGNWLFDLNTKKTASLDEHGYAMLSIMQRIARETQGFFDPTIGRRLSELGYGNKDFFFSQEAFVHRDFDAVIRFDRNSVEILGDVELEFGGIGKGYLIDWIFAFLCQRLDAGTEFLINFGGDMASVGIWKVALESPFAEGQAIGVMNLENSFLACSAGNKRKFGSAHHLVNPFSGTSAQDVAAVFVATPNTTEHAGMLTDGFATALSVMDFETSCQTLTRNPYLEGVIVQKTGKFFKSEHSVMEVFVG